MSPLEDQVSINEDETSVIGDPPPSAYNISVSKNNVPLPEDGEVSLEENTINVRIPYLQPGRFTFARIIYEREPPINSATFSYSNGAYTASIEYTPPITFPWIDIEVFDTTNDNIQGGWEYVLSIPQKLTGAANTFGFNATGL